MGIINPTVQERQNDETRGRGMRGEGENQGRSRSEIQRQSAGEVEESIEYVMETADPGAEMCPVPDPTPDPAEEDR